MANRRISLKGKGADLFFGDYTPGVGEAASPPEQMVQSPTAAAEVAELVPFPEHIAVPERKRASAADGKQASKRASTLATQENIVETIRKTVKRPGKEVVYVRLTPEEKGQLADVVYTYKRQGIRTSDNELGRIAINSLLADYQEHGEESLLAKVLAALEA